MGHARQEQILQLYANLQIGIIEGAARSSGKDLHSKFVELAKERLQDSSKEVERVQKLPHVPLLVRSVSEDDVEALERELTRHPPHHLRESIPEKSEPLPPTVLSAIHPNSPPHTEQKIPVPGQQVELSMQSFSFCLF